MQMITMMVMPSVILVPNFQFFIRKPLSLDMKYYIEL